MSDIFISYASRDRKKAEQLTQLLASAGLSVWIDNAAIDAATSWSKEIVSAINGCTVFVVLLSPASLESHNVIKEVSLASEKRKKILPLELEPVTLTDDFEYQLAGIQRAPMTNSDAILRALGKLGLHVENPVKVPVPTKRTDNRTSLIILPFEDLSPSQDNRWFADGLVSELIDALSHVNSLRVLDSKTSLELRGVKQSVVEIGRLFDTRYVIQGTVRKFGDEIKISCSLLDIQTGDHLWQESHRGAFKDIFDIQEAMASKVVEGLSIHLTSNERSKLGQRGTANADAYEMLVRAKEQFSHQTKESLRFALELVSNAIELDPTYIDAYTLKGQLLTSMYRSYDRDPALLEEADALGAHALRIAPDRADVLGIRARVRMYQKKWDEAMAAAHEYVRRAPEQWQSHFTLAFLYGLNGEYRESIAPYLEAVRLNPGALLITMNVVDACMQAGETERAKQIALEHMPWWDRQVRLHPENEAQKVDRGLMLLWAGQASEARSEALSLLETTKDGFSIFRLAILFGLLGDPRSALDACRKSLLAGFRDPQVRKFLDDDVEGVAALKDTTEYQEVERLFESLVQAQPTNPA